MSDEIDKNDNPDHSYKSHATVATTIMLKDMLRRFHKITSAADGSCQIQYRRKKKEEAK